MMEIIEVLDQTQFNMYKQFTSRPQGRGMIAFIASNNITFYDLYCSTCRICISFQSYLLILKKYDGYDAP